MQSEYFKSIFNDSQKGLFRGHNIKDDIESVINIEGNDYYESSGSLPFIRYFVLLNANHDTEYSLVFFINKKRKVVGIKCSIEISDEYPNSISVEEFNSLFEEVSLFFEEKYGKPKVIERNFKEVGKELFYQWKAKVDSVLIQITLSMYKKPSEGLLKSFKIEFE